MSNEKPENIRKAMIEGDTDHLAAAGRKGARVRAFNREEEVFQMKKIEMEHEYRRILHEEGEEAAEEFLKSSQLN